MLKGLCDRLNWNNMRIIIWGIFLIFLFYQYQLVYLYYDDFGYCSLSYGYNVDVVGTEFSIGDIGDYIMNSYFEVNGRIFTNLLIVICAWLGGLKFMRIIIPICLLGIYLLMYKYFLEKNNMNEVKKTYLMISMIFSYGLFNINICNYGLYWFVAAFGYIVPMLLFLYFIMNYRKSYVQIPCIALLLCISSEQMVAMVVSFILSNLVYDYFLKVKISKVHIISLLLAFFGTMIMIGSPASRGRLENTEQMSLVLRIIENAKYIEKTFFSGLGNIIICVFLICAFVLAIELLNKFQYKKGFWLHMIFFICTCVIIVTFLMGELEVIRAYEGVLFLFCLFFFIELFCFYFLFDRDKISLVVATMASMGILLLVPEIPQRTFIPFLFMLIFFAIDIVLIKLNSNIMMKYVQVLMIPYIIFCSLNMIEIYQGYEKNKIVLEYNNCALIEARDKIYENQSVEEVKLYKLVDDLYGGQQVYQENLSYMKIWIDEYYNLPHNITYIYYEYPNAEEIVKINLGE